MSRGETALNVFLGAVLLLVFAVILVVALAGLMLGVRAFDRALLYLFPSASHHSEAIYLFIFGVIILLFSPWNLRRRCWRRAFVEFAVSISIFLICLHQVRSNRDIDLPWYFTMLLAFTISRPAGPKEDMERKRFLSATTLLGLATLSALGLLGSLHDLVNISLFVVAIGWWLIEIQREHPKPGIPLSPPTP